MKKVVCLIAVLALTASVFAAEPITITATAVGDTITLGYNATGATKPVGFSLIVDCGAGEVANAAAVGLADSFFDVFIDFAADDPAAYQAGANPTTGVLAGAHPLAVTDAAGAAAFPAKVFAISAAELANVATIPATGTICTLKITGTATVCFSEDTLRGGVVDTNGDAMTVTLPGCVEVGAIPECFAVGTVFNYAGAGTAINMTVTQAQYNVWVALGKPACWCCLAQKAGNAVTTNNNATVNTADLAALRASWNKAYTAVGYNACADFNCQGNVNTADLAILRGHWNMTVGTCPQP